MADFSLSAEINADYSGFTTAIKKATESISKGTKKWGLDLDKFYDKGTSLFKSFGVDIDKFASHFGVSGKLVAGLATVSAALVKFGESMNVARANIAKGTGAIGEDLEKLQDDFQTALLSGIGRSTDEISKMMADINTRFGLVGESLVNLTDDFDKFAEITDTDTKTAINGLADVMAKWNIATEDANPLMQQLSMTAKMSGASVTDLMNSMKSGQAIFSQFGMSGTQSLAFLGTLAKNGVGSSVALTAMKTALVKFSAEGKNASQGLKEISDKIKNATSDSEAMNLAVETFGSKAGVEMVKILKSSAMSTDDFANALRNAGGSMESTFELSRTFKSAVDDLKSVFNGLGAGIGSGFNDMFRDVIDSVKIIVSQITPIITPVLDVIGDTFSFIGKMIKQLFTVFEEFKKRFGEQMNGVSDTLLNLRNNFKGILNNIFKNFQSIFNAIFAMLDGNWRLAWLNVKVVMQRSADSVLRILSTIINAFKGAINNIIGLINNAIEVYNKLPSVAKIFGDIGKINLIQDVDLSTLTGLTSAIENTEKEIEVLSGKASQKVIGDIGAVADATTKATEYTETKAVEAFNLQSNWDEKLLQQKISNLEFEQKNEERRAKNAGATEEEIYKITQKYSAQILELRKEQLNKQKELAIKNVKDYENELKNNGNLTEDNAKKIAEEIKNIAEYYSNEIENLDRNLVDLVKNSTSKIKQTSKEYVNYFEKIADSSFTLGKVLSAFMQKKNEAYKKAMETGETAEDVQIDKMQVLIGAIHSAINVSKKLVTAYQKAFTTIVSFANKMATSVINVTKKMWSEFKNAISINLDDGLDTLLKFEDSVLTFIVETIPKFPEFIKSALESIDTLVKNITQKVNFSEIEAKFSTSFKTIGDDIVKTSKNVMQLVTSAISTFSSIISVNADTIVSTVGGIALSILDNLPSITSSIISALDSLLTSFSAWFSENEKTITDDLLKSITNILDFVFEFLSSDGLAKIIESVGNIFVGIIKYMGDNAGLIGNALSNLIESLTSFLHNAVIALVETLPDLIPQLVGSISELFLGLIDILTDEDVIDGLIDSCVALIESLIEKGLPALITATVKVVLALFQTTFKMPEIIIEIIKALGEGFRDADWGGMWKDIKQSWFSFWESITNPMSEIADKIVEGLKTGFEKFKDIFNQYIIEPIKFAFNSLISFIKTPMNAVIDIVNTVISGLNKVSVKVPDWVPIFGGKKFGIDIPKISKLYTGTNNAEQGLTLVGEQGPELIDMRGGERVYNAHNTEKILSGASGNQNTFNVTFNNLQDTSAFTMLQQLKRYNRQMAVAGVF